MMSIKTMKRNTDLRCTCRTLAGPVNPDPDSTLCLQITYSVLISIGAQKTGRKVNECEYHRSVIQFS